MTTETTAGGAQTAPAASEKTPEQYRTELDDFGTTALERAEAWAKEIADFETTLKAAKGDKQGLLETLRETSKNPEVLELNAKIEQLDDVRFQLDQKRDELLAPEVEALSAKAQEQASGLDEKVKDLRSKFNNARKFFLDTLDGNPEQEKIVLALWPKLPGARGAAATGRGAGVRRIRKRDWKITQGEAVKVFDNASAAAKFVNLETADFQKLFFTAAGSEEVEKWADNVTFTVPVEDGIDYSVESRNTEGAKPQAPVIEEAVGNADDSGDAGI